MDSTALGYKYLADYIESADHCQRFINKLNGDVFVSPTGLDPIGDFTLDWIFSRLMRIGGVDGEAIEFVLLKLLYIVFIISLFLSIYIVCIH